MKNNDYLNFPGLSHFLDKLKTLFVTKDDAINLVGKDGKDGISITSVTQTTTSNVDSGINVVTVELSDGTISSFNIKNGSKGLTGASGINGVNGTRGSQIFWGTAITGTNTTGISFSNSDVITALVNDLYINTNTWNIYQCTTSGDVSTAKWTYKGNIKGVTGDTGASGTNATTTAIATTSSNGLMSKEMVTKLNGIATGANAYIHPTTSGNKHIPSGGASGQILRWSSDGTAAWGADNNTTYTNFVKSGSGAKAGLVPAPSTTAGTTKYLREDGTWQVPPNNNTDTKNTAGSTDSSSKLFLIGATSQAANPQTYSHDTAYIGTDGCLYSNSTRVRSELMQSAEPTTQKVGDYWLQEYT